MFITPYSQKNIDRNFPARRGISMAENKKAVSFTSLQSALEYIAKARLNNPIKEYENFVRLKNLDLDKISDICEGLPTLKGWTARILKLVTTRFEGIMLQTGCIHQCSHCGVDSEKKLTTMKWDNFTALADDIGILTKLRLGYNPFRRPSNTVTFFKKSDPMMYKSKGTDEITHNIFDAAKYYYEKTGTRTIITTAGWPIGNKHAQKAAESFIEHPECLDNFTISIHSFHDYMQKSIKYAQAGEHDQATLWRNKYIDMMANVIKSTIGLKDNINTYGIMLEYDSSSSKQELFLESSKDLLDEIFDKLRAEGINVNYFLNGNYSDFHSIRVERRAIEHVGRGASYASKDALKPSSNIFSTMNSHGIEESATGITPDGTIYINPLTEPGRIKMTEHKLPFKLSFPFPTENHSKRLPPPRIEIID